MPSETEIGRLVVRLVGDSSSYQKMLQDAKRETATAAQDMEKVVSRAEQIQGTLEKAGEGFLRFGERARSVGTQLSLGLTAPIVGAGAMITKAGLEFESAFTGVRKTVDATDEQMAELREGFKQLSKEIPISTTEIFAVGEAAGQLGIEVPNILGFTRVMADLGTTTNLSAQQAAVALARLANITQLPQSRFDRLGATIVDLGNKMATTEAEITEMALRIAGAGKQVGLTNDQILAFAAGLSSVGIEAQAGGTAISRVFVEIAKSVKSADENLGGFALVAGMSAEEFSRRFEEDAAQALLSFIAGLRRMSDEGADVFTMLESLGIGEIRVRDALLRAAGAGDLFTRALEIGSRAWEENTALTKEAELRYGTAASRMKLLTNEIGLALNDLSEDVIPFVLKVVREMVDVLNSVVERWKDLSPTMRENVVRFLAVSAVAGPLTIVLGNVASAIGGVLTTAKTLIGTGRLLRRWARTLGRSNDGTARSYSLLQRSIQFLFNPIQTSGVLFRRWGRGLGFVKNQIVATVQLIKQGDLSLIGGLRQLKDTMAQTSLGTLLFKRNLSQVALSTRLFGGAIAFVVGFKFGQWLDETFDITGIKSFNDELERNARLERELAERRGIQQQRVTKETGRIDDPTKRAEFLAKEAEKAQRELEGVQAQVRRAEKLVEEQNTLGNKVVAAIASVPVIGKALVGAHDVEGPVGVGGKVQELNQKQLDDSRKRLEEQRRVVNELKEAQLDAANAAEDAARRQADLVKQQTLTPEEAFSRDAESLKALLEKELISQETFDRAIAGLKETRDAMTQFGDGAEEAGRKVANMDDTLGIVADRLNNPPPAQHKIPTGLRESTELASEFSKEIEKAGQSAKSASIDFRGAAGGVEAVRAGTLQAMLLAQETREARLGFDSPDLQKPQTTAEFFSNLDQRGRMGVSENINGIPKGEREGLLEGIKEELRRLVELEEGKEGQETLTIEALNLA